MNDYSANRVAGHSYFFTVRLSARGSTLLTDHFAAFGEAIRQARSRKPFHVDAWVALPDHAHAIWTLPPGDHDCANRWRAVKIAFSKSLGKSGAGTGLDKLWEPHYQQHAVGNDDYAGLVDYIHHNPLRHGLCAAPHEWQWSSVHRFIAAGMMAGNKGASV